ncbi:MAG: hypothetical protein J0M24_13825 [Verrucomicrobia bacterium]|nr:hypothetical protein [Verrucomicrobiota bacterium]
MLRPDGQPFVGQITFDPLDAPLVVAPGQVVVQTKVISSTNPSGQFSATLEAGRYRLTAATINGIRFTVPDTDGSYDILSLVTGGLNQAPDFVPVTGAGDMLQSVYDPNGDGKVSSAVTADSVPWSGITSAPSLQPLDADLTELAANQGIIRTNGVWEGTLTGEDISAQGITAGLFTSSTPFTGAELPETLAQVGFVKELTPAIAATLEDLQAATVYQVSRWAYVQTGDPIGHWVYCPESTTASNGTNVVRPNIIVSDSSPGRWEKIPAASGSGTEETASSILTKLLTVDGAGSGLDADTLDGQSSAAFQPADSDLTSIAALTTTSYGRGLLDDADAAALRSSAGLGTLATQNGIFSGTSSGTNTGDETASGILTKLLTVDGSGSGLDADTLDGQSSAAFQPVDSDLTSIAALTTTSFGRGLLDDADAAAGRTTLGVVIGTDVQAYDADLADLADGSLSGSKVGTGIDAGNITTGTVASARLPSPGRPVTYVVDNSGSAITAGDSTIASVPVEVTGTITKAVLLADVSGSAVVDVRKSTYSGFPTTSSIAASAKPTLSAAQKASDTTLTGWTTSVTAGDVLQFRVDSASTVTRLTLVLTITPP